MNTSAMHRKFLVLAFAGLVVFSGFAWSQQQSQPPPPPPQDRSSKPPQSGQSHPTNPPLRVTTRLVTVNVIVHDRDGKPVTGLTKEDFVLIDGGQRQKVASFSEQTTRLTANNAPATPNHFSNISAPGDAQAPLTVIVIDAYNTYYHDVYWRPNENGFPCHFPERPCPPPMMGTVFNQVEKFIGQMQPQDRVALYELAKQIYLLQDFTSDAVALRRGLVRGKEYAEDISYSWSTTTTSEMVDRTMAGMHAIAERLAKVPGRKNLIWLSTGFPYKSDIHPGNITDISMDQSAKTLGNSDLPLYAVDGHGLEAPWGGGGPVPGGGSRGPTAGGGGPTPASGSYGGGSMWGGPPGRFNEIRNLSEATGGRAFYDTNDLAGAIRRAIDDSSSTYLLGYYPDHNKWNGEFREIKVKVNRPGMEVRARKGYYAVGDSATPPQREAEQIAEAIRSPVESTDLGLDVHVDPVDVPGARQLKVKITLDAGQLRFQQKGARWTDNISEVWAEFDAEGKQVAQNSKTINLNPGQDAYKQLLQNGISFSETVALANDAAEVRLVLRDVGNGSIGSVRIPLTKLFAAAGAQPEVKK